MTGFLRLGVRIVGVVALIVIAGVAAGCSGGSEPEGEAAVPGARPGGRPTPPPSERAAATRALFAGIAPDGPGCTIAVARGGRVIFAEGYGLAELEPPTPITPATVMDIASTSKQFTALAILLLADDGKLDLDDDVRAHVPELPDYGAVVTLGQMMHHQSGIPDYVNLMADRIAERTTPADALAALRAAPELEFTPGSRFAYSNSNYFLFSLVVERAAKLPLPRFLQARVFAPAGMAAVMDPVGAVSGKARSYRRTATGWESADSRWEQLGDGAIQTTPTELVRWARQYWAPTVGSPAVHRARLAGAVSAGPLGEDYGAGIVRRELADGAVALSHAGGWAGFSTLFIVVPDERLAIAGSCNGVTESGAIVQITEDELLEIWRA